MAAARIEKRVSEKISIGFQYQDPDLPSGETIDNEVTTVSPSGLTLGTPSTSGDTTSVFVSAGSAGTTYTVTFKVTISTGAILMDDYIVEVVAD